MDTSRKNEAVRLESFLPVALDMGIKDELALQFVMYGGQTVISSSFDRVRIVNLLIDEMKPLFQYMPGFKEIPTLSSTGGLDTEGRTFVTSNNTSLSSKCLSDDISIYMRCLFVCKSAPDYPGYRGRYLKEAFLLLTRDGRLCLLERNSKLTNKPSRYEVLDLTIVAGSGPVLNSTISESGCSIIKRLIFSFQESIEQKERIAHDLRRGQQRLETVLSRIR